MAKISKASKIEKVGSKAVSSDRYTYRPKASDEQKELVVEKTVDTEPKGYLMLKQVILEANKQSVPTSRVMKAMGGNRGVGEPLSENWVFVYYKRSRWLPKACLKDLPKLAKMRRGGGRPAQERKELPKAKVVAKPAAKPVKAQPKAQPVKTTVRDSKGKVVQKANPKDIPGTPVVLKKHMSTTRTAEAPAPTTKKAKRHINEGGIPVLDLVEE